MFKAQTFQVDASLGTFTYEKASDSWLATFSDSIVMTFYSLWRLLKNGKIVAASSDHGQYFGLSSPLDLAQDIFSRLRSTRLTQVEIKPDTGDLCLVFADGHHLEVYITSMNYECYDMIVDGERYIATGGGL
jgi:hypothetical protein